MEIKKPTVLIADDCESLRMYLTELLSYALFEVIGQAVDGEDAVSMYQKNQADIVLLDLDMPKKNGLMALKEIKKINSNAFVIMISGIDSMDSIDACLVAGASDYLRKDCKLQNIPKLLMALWEKHQ